MRAFPESRRTIRERMRGRSPRLSSQPRIAQEHAGAQAMALTEALAAMRAPQNRAGLRGNAGGGAVRGARRNPESLRSMRGRRRWRRPRRPPRPRIAQEHAAGTADYCRQTAESLRSMRRRPRVTGPAPRGTYFVGIPFSALSLGTSSQFTQVGALPAGSLDWRPWRRGAHTARNAE